jgi:hypothetical protein
MRIDLFDFVEGVFRGFIYFFYNVFATLWDLASRPRRAPLRRYRAYLKTSKQQVGGLTFLFVLIFAVFGLTPAIGSGEGLGKVFSAPPNLGGQEVWFPLAGAMLATVLIDAPLRLLLHRSLGNRHRKRRLVLELIEYSLAWPLLLGVLVPILLVVASDRGWVSIATLLAGSLLVWLITILACGPAARFLLVGLCRKPVSAGRSAARLVRQGAAQFILFVWLLFSIAVGALFSAHLALSAAEPHAVEEVLELPHLRCFLDGPNPHVVVAAKNPGKSPIFLDVDRELVVRVSDPDEMEELNAFELTLIAEGGRDALPLVIEPGATKLLRLAAEGRPRRPFAEGDLCMLRAVWGAPKFENYFAQRIEKPDSAHFKTPAP